MKAKAGATNLGTGTVSVYNGRQRCKMKNAVSLDIDSTSQTRAFTKAHTEPARRAAQASMRGSIEE